MPVTANSLVTPQTPISGNALCTAANTNYAAPTQAVELIAAQTNGARITTITALALATVTATELQLYTSKDGGTTKRFLDSQTMTAHTVVQTAKQTPIDMGYSDTTPLILGANEGLYAAIGVANATGIVFRAEGAAY